MDNGLNRFVDDLDIFLTFFFIFGSTVDVPMDEDRLIHNALTRRIDPRHPEGPWLDFFFGRRFGHFGPIPNFFRQTNHTNLTRRIDPRYPEPPYSPIAPNISFHFFVFWVSGQRKSVF